MWRSCIKICESCSWTGKAVWACRQNLLLAPTRTLLHVTTLCDNCTTYKKLQQIVQLYTCNLHEVATDCYSRYFFPVQFQMPDTSKCAADMWCVCKYRQIRITLMWNAIFRLVGTFKSTLRLCTSSTLVYILTDISTSAISPLMCLRCTRIMLIC